MRYIVETQYVASLRNRTNPKTRHLEEVLPRKQNNVKISCVFDLSPFCPKVILFWNANDVLINKLNGNPTLILDQRFGWLVTVVFRSHSFIGYDNDVHSGSLEDV